MSLKCFASYPINTQHSRSYGNIKSKMVSCASQLDHSMILEHLDTCTVVSTHPKMFSWQNIHFLIYFKAF